MKFYDSHFEDYIVNNSKTSLHPFLNELYNSFPEKIQDFKNLIFYGPKGAGKYSQMLSAIKHYSPSELSYEKKLNVLYNKNNYYFKISDIHYEIDMSLLGCNSKLLFNEIYNQIVDIILAKTEKSGIIVCKYFHEIHSELLEVFYSYMQTNTNSSIDIKFIIISEHISFIPDNILNCCQLISIPRPSRSNYNKIIEHANKTFNIDVSLDKNSELNELTNIKNIYSQTKELMLPHKFICMKIINSINNINSITFLSMRDQLYDIFIYNLDVYECINYILEELIKTNKIKENHCNEVIMKTYSFLQYYNNNYRPIYHLENFIYYLVMKVNSL